MLKYGNKEFRNLEEQVQQNKEDIAKHYAQDRVLADFGIKVVGQVDTAEELPDPTTYEGDYGNAYAVGTEPPYVYYIWTRANNISPTDYWFDFGEITVAGPQGPKGDTVVGPQGEPGNKWYVQVNPPTGGTYKEGDINLNPNNGTLWRYNGTRWLIVGNIRGPVGAVGPSGNDAGTIQIASIRGTAPNVEVLATVDPTTVPAGSVYLVGEDMPLDVYLPIEGMWQKIGSFNSGTIVSIDGIPQDNVSLDYYLTIEGSDVPWEDYYEGEYGILGQVPVIRGTKVYGVWDVGNGMNADEGWHMPQDTILASNEGGMLMGTWPDVQDTALENGNTRFVPSFDWLIYQFSAMSVNYQAHVEIKTSDRQTVEFYLTGVMPEKHISASEETFDTIPQLASALANLNYIFYGFIGTKIPVHGYFEDGGDFRNGPLVDMYRTATQNGDYSLVFTYLDSGGQTSSITITTAKAASITMSVKTYSGLLVDY